jgi:TIR domain
MAKKQPDFFDKPMTSSEMEELVKKDPIGGLNMLKANFGVLSARVTMLNIAVKERLKESYIKNYPPSVFIAYKWEDEKHNEWVKKLAQYLRLKGYDVLLDQDHLASNASNYGEVPQYISRMVNSDVFLVVITEKYLDFIEARSGYTTWVFDEYQHAVNLHNHGRLKMQAIWRSGVDLPAFLAMGAINMRNESNDFTMLDEYFPAYKGPILSAEEKIQFRTFINRFDTILNTDYSNPDLLVDLLNANSKFAALYEYQYHLMVFYWLTGQLREAYGIAYIIREKCNNDDHIIMVAQIFDKMKDLPTLFKFLHNARMRFFLNESAQYHYLCATALFEQNSIFAARNHFGCLKKLIGDKTNISESLRKEICDKYDELSVLLSQYSPKYLFQCSECAAEYYLIDNFDKICGDCGTEYESTIDQCDPP